MSTALQGHGLLRDLQEEIRNLLQEDDQLFAPPRVSVLSEDLGDLEKEIEKAIGPLGSGGGVVIIGMPSPQPSDLKKPFLFTVEIEIQCIEKSIVNRSMSGNKVKSDRLGEIVHTLLWRYQPTSSGWTQLERVKWDTGQIQGSGNLGDIITFRTETVYSVETLTD